MAQLLSKFRGAGMEPKAVYSGLCDHPARIFTELYREKTVAVGGKMMMAVK